MALFRSKYFKVEANGTTRLFKAMREAHVRSHLADEFNITAASHDDCMQATRDKVEITDLTTQQPGGQG